MAKISKAKKWHPDAISRQGIIFANRGRFVSFMSEVFAIYREGYELLLDKSKRMQYDLSLKVKRGKFGFGKTGFY